MVKKNKIINVIENIKEIVITKKIYIPLILVFTYFVMVLCFINDSWFVIDEFDNFVIGKGIAKGHLLYVDQISQHMPLTYYLSAIFYKLGAVSITEQRMAFYMFYSINWTIIYCRYKDTINKKALLVFPLIFCSMFSSYPMGTCVLSEHIAGIGAVYLLLEYFKFYKEKKLKMNNCIFISYSIVLTFGTIFISAFCVFVIAIGVFALEISWIVEKKIPIKKVFLYLVNRYWRLIVSIAVPWICLLGYYLKVNALDNFFYGAYRCNIEIYSKYNGGLGTDLKGTFLSILYNVSKIVTDNIMFNEINITSVRNFLVISCVIVFAIHTFKEKNKIVGITLVLFISSLTIRGTFNYHGTQFVAIIALLSADTLARWYNRIKNKSEKDNIFQKYALVLCSILVFSGYADNMFKFAQIKLETEQTSYGMILKKITDEDEAIWMATFSNDIAMWADRATVGAAMTTPWTWEGMGAPYFEDFIKDAPRVAIVNENLEVWGCKINEYASEAINYIKENYTVLPDGSNCIYVKNDYYDTACRKIWGNEYIETEIE